MMRFSLLAGLAAVFLASSTAGAVQVFGLTTRDQLISFDSSTPNNLTQAVFISGLANNESLLGIDFRPANNVLYAIGTFGNLYTLNTTTGAATLVAPLTSGGNPVLLNGVEFGFDFNPTVDRIRLISNLGGNYRINPNDGTTIVDGSINPGGYGISASAYLNNDNDPSTGTTLYNIDHIGDQLTIQNPANSGTQVNVGSLGLDVTALAGFDIFTPGAGIGPANIAYAALQQFGTTGSSFYTIDLTTGAATALGVIGQNQSSDSLAVRDIAVTPVPEPGTMAALAIGLLSLRRRNRKR
jgi:hypothetical protein